MDGFQAICTIFVTVVAYLDFCVADREYMESTAYPTVVSINFEAKFDCTMNIQPDDFKWKFYPLHKNEAYNPKARISLTTSPFQFVPTSKYENSKKTSVLTLQVDSTEIAGDYQCLAYYGASVVASVPWRVTIANIMDFPTQAPQKTTISVVPGNTINWRCEPPVGNPEPYVDYFKDGKYFKPLVNTTSKSLIIPNVTKEDSGTYTCQAGNVERTVKSEVEFILNVKDTSTERPKFITKPKSVYHVLKNDAAFLECSAIGNPVPKVVWSKKNGILPKDRTEVLSSGLMIRNVMESDNGIYECIQKNHLGTVSQSILLDYNEPPSINCLVESVDVTQGDSFDVDCGVTGSPKPEISWFLNGLIVTNDSRISTEDNKIFFKPAEKRHAGNLQIFARNVVGTVYSSILVKVFPLSTTQENIGDIPAPPTRGGHKKNKISKHGKVVPPSKPNITRIDDNSVLLRWTVQSKGLPIQFFKVQYKELGPASEHNEHSRGKGSKWMTLNDIIDAHVRNFEVKELKTDHYYRFRIAAVYSNNDNKNSLNSEKFHLKKMDFDNRNPLPVPVITATEAINSTSVKIYWKCDPSPNITVEGFLVNYNAASSAADYVKTTVDGVDENSFVLTHLQPSTVYDIKLQSFTSKSASQYSSIHKVRTLDLVSSTVIPSSVSSSENIESAGISKLYIIIAGGVLGGCGVIFAILAFLFYWKKNSNRGCDKTGVEERHRQTEGNEYVVGPKTGQRSNGCVPSNRITITANPLADADNKNQNMIEMSCLSSQNNNCSTVQPSVSGEDSPTNSKDKKNKTREKRIRNKHNADSNTSGENFV